VLALRFASVRIAAIAQAAQVARLCPAGDAVVGVAEHVSVAPLDRLDGGLAVVGQGGSMGCRDGLVGGRSVWIPGMSLGWVVKLRSYEQAGWDGPG
jgi:hypothetical protein